ncbi:cerebellin-4-like [Brevipalpus obovatus]|uniref:cerebellin-4-like n=1 Tax=Brevipalpus obovatus TaxID=246614 RepID=UPI003D9F1C73
MESVLILLGIMLLNVAVSTAFDPIAFTAIRGSMNDNYISFSGLAVNNNNAHFHPAVGVFKCTSPGLYFFTFNALTHADSDLRINLRVNKFTMLSAYGGGATPMTITGSSILQLQKDDVVYLFVDRGDINESNKMSHVFTSFSGVQLSENGGGLLNNLISVRSVDGQSKTQTSEGPKLEMDEDDKTIEIEKSFH